MVVPADPTGSASPPNDPAKSGNDKGDPPSDPKSSSVAGDPPASPLASLSGTSDPQPIDQQNPPTDPKLPVIVTPQGEDPPAQKPGLGAIIYNTFGKFGPEAPLPPQSIFIIGSQTVTANPTGFKVNNVAISPGGLAQTVDGTRISLDQAGVLALDSSTISLTDPPATAIWAVAGQTFTPNPSAFSIAGGLITAGGPAVTISGTVVSLGQSGALAIGSSTIDLSNPSDTLPGQVYTVGDQTFTPNPSAFPIAGTAISADGPAVTISGMVVSLGQDGVLKVGSSTISLPTPVVIPPGKVYTVAGQTFIPSPSGFFIAGTTIAAGGPAVTVGGTIISLGQSGALAIGSSTVALPNPAYSPGEVYTVAGQTFTPNPSGFSIAGTTISAGGPAVTVGGTIISLETSGTLLVGSSTIPLLTPQTTFSSDVDIDGFDVKAGPSSAVVDGVTLSAAAPGVTVSGSLVSLEAGGATLDIRTGRFALPTGSANGSVGVQQFLGGQSKGFGPSLSLVLCGTFMLLVWQ